MHPVYEDQLVTLAGIYRAILSQVLCPDGERCLVAVASLGDADEDDGRTGLSPIAERLFPGHCTVVELPGDEGYVAALKDVLAREHPDRVLLLPPWLAQGYVPRDVWVRYPGGGIAEWALETVRSELLADRPMGVVLPANWLQSESMRTFRVRLLAAWHLLYVIQDAPHPSCLRAHTSFEAATLVLSPRGEGSPPVRFFSCPHPTSASASEVTADLSRIIKQGGGETCYGYVLRSEPDPSRGLSYGANHPDLARRQRDIDTLGETRPLAELVDVMFGRPTAGGRDGLINGESEDGVPLVEGRDIRPDGTISAEGTRWRVPAAGARLLRPGDICLRRIQPRGDRGAFVLAEVTEKHPPMAAGNHVIVLRPRVGVPDESLRLLVPYLRSEATRAILDAMTTGSTRHGLLMLHASALMELPVPVPDRLLLGALDSLQQASAAFARWQTEAEAAQSALFEFPSAMDARLYVLQVGRQARVRRRAAAQVDDFGHRVRTRFPHPVAYRWRTVESAHEDIEGYISMLEAAEVTVAYLASAAILLARSTSQSIAYLADMGERLSEGRRGAIGMGDWIAVIREICQSRSFSRLPDDVPFYELSQVWRDADVDAAVQRLKERRDDQAHLRGPKGPEVPAACVGCRRDLEVLLAACEFLTEYPLVYIEETRRDSLAGVTHFRCRALMGDHPLVPLTEGQTESSDVEAYSLYMVDRLERLHLLRPLLTRRVCPKCGTWATFHLESYRKADDVCTLKSLEHGHTVDDADIASAFRAVGILQ